MIMSTSRSAITPALHGTIPQPTTPSGWFTPPQRGMKYSMG